MDKKDIEKIIDEKQTIHKKISAQEEKLLNAKSKVKFEEFELWVKSDWETILKKPTDKTKKAYVDGKVRPFKEKVESFENKINEYKRDVEILNDKLKYLIGESDD